MLEGVIRRSPLARAVASLVLASGVLLGTAGCVFITPTATLDQYDPSDGVSGQVGDVALRNVIAISNEDGSAVSLFMAAVNTGDAAARLNIQVDSAGAPSTLTVVIPAGQTTLFGNTTDDEQIVILEPGVPAGGLLPVYFQYGTNEGTQLFVPVLNADFEYADLGPRIVEVVEEPAPTEMPAPTETPAP